MGIEQIIVIVVVLLISFLNWAFGEGGLKDLLKGPKNEEPSAPPARRRSQPYPGTQQPEQPAKPAQEDGEQERMRRFFEALGVPAEQLPPTIRREPPPPPPPVPKPVARPLSRPVAVPTGAESQEPEVVTARAGGESIRRAASSAMSSARSYMKSPAVQLSKAEQEALDRLKKKKTAFPETVSRVKAPGERAKLGDLLGGAEALRRAVIVREVLGPPKALQSETGIPGLRRP